MKWITLISLVILLSFSESRNLQKRHHHEDDDHEKTIAEMYSTLGQDLFQAVTLIMCSQYLQKNSLDEVTHLVTDFSSIAESCIADKDGADCSKPMEVIFLNTLCRHQDLGAKNEGFSECCSKADPERNACFVDHKITDPHLLPPHEKSDAEQQCEAWKNNPKATINGFIYKVAQRHPFLHSPVITSTAGHYKNILEECCQQTDIDECIKEKKTALIKEIKTVNVYQKNICSVMKKFGTRVIQAEKLVQLAQKNPKASLEMLAKLSKEITHLHKTCCDGHMIKCMEERLEITKFVCSNQEKVSSKLKECCDKPIGEQGECIVKAENDDKPEGLSERVPEFIEDPKVCESFKQDKDTLIGRFLYAYGRRHPELASVMIVRIGKGYEHLLEECCHQDNPAECLPKGEDKLKAGIIEAKTLLKENCDAFHNLGAYHFMNAMLLRYGKKMPQVRKEVLLELGRHMVAIAERCCDQPEEKKMPCAETGVSMIINDMCDRQEKVHISDRVSKCCDDSYSERRPCFSHMGPDENYVPPPITPDMFHFHADLCSSSEKETEQKKQELLIALLKVKPHITQEQFEKCSQIFLTMVGTCCKDAVQEACFTKEGPEVIKNCEAVFPA